MFCKKCGALMNDGAAFCPACGWKTGESVTKQESSVSNVPVNNKHANGPSSIGLNVSDNTTPGEIHAQSKNVSNTVPQKKKYPIAIVLASVFGTIIVLFIIIMVIGGRGSEPEQIVVADVQLQEDTQITETVETTKEKTSAVSRDVNVEAIEQLLVLIDEVLNEEKDLREKNEGKQVTKDTIETTHDYCESIKNHKKRVYDIDGLPENIRDAGIDFFDLYENAWEVTYLDNKFFLGYDELTKDIDLNDPTIDAQKNYDNFIKRYNAIDCPDNWRNPWEKVGKSVEYYAGSVNRYYEADKLDDPLRTRSAKNLMLRFFKVIKNESKTFEKLLNDEVCEFAYAQELSAQSIRDEIAKVSELSDGDIEQYEFKYNIENVIPTPILYDSVSTIYPSLYNSYGSFLTIELGCLHGAKDIIVECEIPGLSQQVSESYHIGAGLHALDIKPPALTKGHDLDNAWDTQIKVSIYDKEDNSIIDKHSENVHIASRNDFEWYSDDYGTITMDNILCFLSPESEAITGLKRNAIDNLSQMTDGKMNALVGYQGPYYLVDSDGDGKGDNMGVATYLTTFLQTASLMRAMSDMGVKYTNDAFSVANEGQHILYPDQVIEHKTGLCIETSLVIASALQSMEMHTFLVFPTGHAQVAVETWNGSGEYLLIETTSTPNQDSDFVDDANHYLTGVDNDNYPISYLNAEQWKQYLIQKDCYVIDCSDGAFLGITPFVY